MEQHVCDVQVNPSNPCGLAFVVVLDGRPTQHGQHLSIGRDEFTFHTRFCQRFDPCFASFGQSLNDVVHGSFGQLHLGIPQKLIERRVGVGEETAVVQGEDGVVGVV